LTFNATFNNISAISWRPVLVVEEAGKQDSSAPRYEFTWKSNRLIKKIETRL